MEDYKKIISAEKTINAIWPYVLEKQNANYNLEQSETEAKLCKSNYMPGVWMTRICIPITVVCMLIFFLWPQQKDLFGDYYRGVVATFAVMIGFVTMIGIFVGVILRLIYGKGYHAAKDKISQMEQLVKEAEEKLEMVKKENMVGLMLASNVIPENAMDPEHIRLIASYFETKRVQTMAEALPLLEMQLYREKMERLQREQIALAEKTAKELQRIR